MTSTKTLKRIRVKKINAPFGYFGSKNKIAMQLCEKLPPHNCWVEVFCGSAALTLRKEPAPIEIINDIDNEIVNFFDQLRNNTEALCQAVEWTPYAAHELLNARMKKTDLTELERARRFLVQSMMAINGVFGEERGGFSHSDSYTRNNHEARVNRWNNLPIRLEKVVHRLKDVRVENRDAIEIVQNFSNRPATLLYLDPPYLGDRTNGYSNDANDLKFHTELLDTINQARCMIFISGYEHELYSQMLSPKSGWKMKKIETVTRDQRGNSHQRTEIVWTNKHFVKALNSGRVPIRLTKKEKSQGKVNPERK